MQQEVETLAQEMDHILNCHLAMHGKACLPDGPHDGRYEDCQMDQVRYLQTLLALVCLVLTDCSWTGGTAAVSNDTE
jgi:hypothetical protein